MRYDIKTCEDSDIGFLWDRFDEVFDEFSPLSKENAEEELYVYKITDEDGCIIGGCVLDIDETNIAEFVSLWVDERYRRRGLGAALIMTAEQKAKEKGCSEIVNAFTFDFQAARQLFEDLGYELVGIAEDWPRGHENYTLVKKLDDAEECATSGILYKTGFEITDGTEEDDETIHDALEATYGSDAPRSHPYIDINRKFVDNDGNMIAGCIAGVSGWDALHIDMIWVKEDLRRKGIGTELIGEVEREAKENGAYLSRIGAIGPRAPFFEKLGYTINVIHEGMPEWYDMQKKL